MFDPFVGRTLTPEQWKARTQAIQARLQGLSIDELMRGPRGADAPHDGAHGQRRGGYDPNQPRVPAGHPDGGQWTDDNRWTDDDLRAIHERWADVRLARLRGALQLAAAERLPRNLREVPLYLARKAIEAVYRELASWDLFGYQNPDEVTVAVTTIDGRRDIHGTSSKYGDWRAIDHVEVRRLRAIILRRNPHLAKGPGLTNIPLDAFYHAETNLLLRAARENRGSLAGQTFDVYVDNETCPSCKKVLGYVGLELGNPTVAFINARTGRVMGVVRDGKWHPR
jgi:hypothetical protein